MIGFDEVFDADGKLLSSTLSVSIRLVSVESFFQRFGADEVRSITISTDVRVIVLRSRLFVRTEMIDLDSEEIQNAIKLFVGLGIVTESRVKELLE
jgi:hypothetical protein